mgnify:CR=1 FL=1
MEKKYQNSQNAGNLIDATRAGQYKNFLIEYYIGKVDTNNQVYIKDKTNTTDVCIQDAIAALGGLKLVSLTQSEYDNLATKDSNTLYIINNVVCKRFKRQSGIYQRRFFCRYGI